MVARHSVAVGGTELQSVWRGESARNITAEDLSELTKFAQRCSPDDVGPGRFRLGLDQSMATVGGSTRSINLYFLDRSKAEPIG